MVEPKDVDTLPHPDLKALPAPPKPKALLPPPKRSHWGYLWLILFFGACFLGYRAWSNAQEKKAAAERAQADRAAHRAISISAVAAHTGDIPIYLRGLGTVTAYNTVNIKTRVDGPIVAVNFKEGQNVAKDEVLVEIDPRTYQAAVDQAKGQLARDEAQLNDARANLARYQKLWDEGVIAKQQLDTQAAQVGQFNGTIEADKANIENAQLSLNFTKIRAPIAGRIGLRQVDIGNMVHPGDATPLAVITQMHPISVLFTIPADSLPPVLAKLNAGANLSVEAWDRSDRARIATGKLETVDNQIDPTTGTSRLKAIFDNKDNALFPQQFVNARLLLDTRHNVVIIPTGAVQRGPQGSYVYIVKPDQTATMRPVTLGPAEGLDQQVTSGVAGGEMVITDGQDKLQEGSKVTFGNAPAGSAPGSSPGRGSRGGRGGGRTK